MNAIVAGVLARGASRARTAPHAITLIALFCTIGVGLSLTAISLGFDLGVEFF